MRKITRLTESDLRRIVRRVIKESDRPEYQPLGMTDYPSNERFEMYMDEMDEAHQDYALHENPKLLRKHLKSILNKASKDKQISDKELRLLEDDYYDSLNVAMGFKGETDFLRDDDETDPDDF